jgi:hypothetical protein
MSRLDAPGGRKVRRRAALAGLLAVLSLCACGKDNTMVLNKLAEDYVRLALAIDRHDPGFVDAYCGPAAWREEAAAGEPVPLAELAARTDRLRTALAAQDSLFPRVRFLDAQLRAFATRLRLLRGETLPFAEEVAGLYDHLPRWYPEEALAETHRQLEAVLPGSGPLAPRLRAWEERFVVPAARILPLFEAAAEVCRERTRDFLPLPEAEGVELALVRDRPWGAYNWYLGAGRSRIEINTDLPRRADDVLHYVAHEAYPGHHTELTIKDLVLAHGQGQVEYFVYPLYTPQSLIAEGGADLGVELLFSPAEEEAFYRERLLPQAGMAGEQAALLIGVNRLRGVLEHANGNAALLLFERGAGDAEATAYLERWGLLSAEQAAKKVAFIRAYRGYVFNYRVGYELLRAFITGGEASFEARRERYRHLWTSPATPGLLRHWLAPALTDSMEPPGSR